MNWSAMPLADLRETDDDELDRLMSRVRVVASKDVYALLDQLRTGMNAFNRKLYMARLHHDRLHREGEVDDADAIRQRRLAVLPRR